MKWLTKDCPDFVLIMPFGEEGHSIGSMTCDCDMKVSFADEGGTYEKPMHVHNSFDTHNRLKGKY